VRVAARPLFFDFWPDRAFDRPVMKPAYLLLLLLLLAACERRSDTPTTEESRQLDDAANLLEQAPQNLEAVDDSALNSPAEMPEGNRL
jgi:hypothetical protein